jgi:Putative auto-transporter adhesin, head GIN domain
MKQITFILLSAFISLSVLSCRKVVGEGQVVSETRNETGFNGVAISVPADVVYTQAPTYKVELRAQRNILDLIESPVVNGELRLRFKRNLNLRSFDRVIIHIGSPDMYSLSISGSGKIEVPASIITSRMRLAVSGSGDINIDSLKSTDNIETVISGSGDITVRKGSSVRADILVSGSGKVNMDGVVTNNVDANISGSGNVRVNALQTLKARISGSGDVYYRGTPSITSHVSGSGKIIKL